MSYAGEWQTIRDRFRSQWNATPIAWFDQPFSPPADGSAYVRISIATDEAAQITLGTTGQTFRSVGVVAVQLFVSPALGDHDLASLYLDPLCGIWRGYVANGVDFRTRRAPFARRVGRTEQGSIEWQVLAPYRRETIF